MKRHLLKSILLIPYWAAVSVLWLWSLGVYYYAVDMPLLLKWSVVLLWLLAAVLIWTRARQLRFGYFLPPLFLLFPLLLWTSIHPGRIDEYRPEQSRMPWGEFADNRVIMHDLRSCRYSGNPDAVEMQTGWYDLELNLDSLITMDYFLVYFASWRGIAHTFLSFGFADGEQIALSVEARRGVDVPYQLLPGIYRQFELMYVMGDELDMVGRRLHFDEDPVYMLPIDTPQENMRGFFVNMVQTANSLRAEPQAYNTVTSTCTTQLAAQANAFRQELISLWDWRLIFPGYSGELAQEANLLAVTEPLAEVMEQYLVNPAEVSGDDRHAFSATLHGQ
jgi:hypothetical protein